MHLHLTIKRQRRAGFTLIELLVVGATIAVLAGMLLPALASTRTQSHTTTCLNNEAQLAHAWQLYADANNGTLVLTAGEDSLVSVVSPTNNYRLNQWCMGSLDNI